jgi:hypothetical protein
MKGICLGPWQSGFILSFCEKLTVYPFLFSTGKLEQPGKKDRKAEMTGNEETMGITAASAQATLRPWAMGNESPIEQQNNLNCFRFFSVSALYLI